MRGGGECSPAWSLGLGQLCATLVCRPLRKDWFLQMQATSVSEQPELPMDARAGACAHVGRPERSWARAAVAARARATMEALNCMVVRVVQRTMVIVQVGCLMLSTRKRV